MKLEEKLTCSLPLRIHFLYNSIFGWLLVIPVASFLLMAISERVFEPFVVLPFFIFLVSITWLVAFSFMGLAFGITLLLTQMLQPRWFPADEKVKTRKSVILSGIIFCGYLALLPFPCIRQDYCAGQIKKWVADPVSFFVFKVGPL